MPITATGVFCSGNLEVMLQSLQQSGIYETYNPGGLEWLRRTGFIYIMMVIEVHVMPEMRKNGSLFLFHS
jgi:hypothetical protein